MSARDRQSFTPLYIKTWHLDVLLRLEHSSLVFDWGAQFSTFSSTISDGNYEMGSDSYIPLLQYSG